MLLDVHRAVGRRGREGNRHTGVLDAVDRAELVDGMLAQEGPGRVVGPVSRNQVSVRPPGDPGGVLAGVVEVAEDRHLRRVPDVRIEGLLARNEPI